MADDIRWIRSYVLEEGGGSVGTVCIYQATSPEAIEKHAEIAQLPVDEIIPVADTVVIRPDPEGLGGRLIALPAFEHFLDEGEHRWPCRVDQMAAADSHQPGVGQHVGHLLGHVALFGW
jgi:hypothetical protein